MAENKNAKLISRVEEITPEIEAVAGSAGKKGTGGFVTKLSAAKHATEHGIPVIIMNGEKPTRIYKAIDGKEIGTYFEAR